MTIYLNRLCNSGTRLGRLTRRHNSAVKTFSPNNDKGKSILLLSSVVVVTITPQLWLTLAGGGHSVNNKNIINEEYINMIRLVTAADAGCGPGIDYRFRRLLLLLLLLLLFSLSFEGILSMVSLIFFSDSMRLVICDLVIGVLIRLESEDLLEVSTKAWSFETPDGARHAGTTGAAAAAAAAGLLAGATGELEAAVGGTGGLDLWPKDGTDILFASRFAFSDATAGAGAIAIAFCLQDSEDLPITTTAPLISVALPATGAVDFESAEECCRRRQINQTAMAVLANTNSGTTIVTISRIFFLPAWSSVVPFWVIEVGNIEEAGIVVKLVEHKQTQTKQNFAHC